jgi:hypothetical protein
MKPSKPHDVPAQRMSLTIQQRSTAGLNVLASRTGERGVPGVVLLQVHEEPFELEWKLTPEQARALSDKLLEAAGTCNRLDSITGTACSGAPAP